MDNSILGDLLGPFAMDTPPTREGFYVVSIRGTTRVEMWYWNSSMWEDSDDGLGDPCPVESASGWYGNFQAATERNDDVANGLDA